MVSQKAVRAASVSFAVSQISASIRPSLECVALHRYRPFPNPIVPVILQFMSYQPAPIDTTTVILSPDLQALTERLAENAHDLWAAQRIADGWTLGAKRDDGAKEHPCLVPYADLPDSEKAYDRNAALGTLKAIVALGYKLHRPDSK